MFVRYAILFLLAVTGSVSAQQIQIETERSGIVTAEISGRIRMKVGNAALRFDNATFSFEPTNGIVIGKGNGACSVRCNDFELNASSVQFELRRNEIRFQAADAMTAILRLSSRSGFTLAAEPSVKLECEHFSFSSSNARLEFHDGLLKISDTDGPSVFAETEAPALEGLVPTIGVAPPNDGVWGIETPPTAGVRVR